QEAQRANANEGVCNHGRRTEIKEKQADRTKRTRHYSTSSCWLRGCGCGCDCGTRHAFQTAESGAPIIPPSSRLNQTSPACIAMQSLPSCTIRPTSPGCGSAVFLNPAARITRLTATAML